MKRFLRSFLITLLTLWLTTKIVLGFLYTGGFQTLFLATIAFTFINFFLKPLAKLFFLPLTLLTLGLFSWAINVGMLYLLTIIVTQIKVNAWQFPGFSFQGFIIPKIYFSYFLTLILTSFVISFFSTFFRWLEK